jgi:hypothetical protein
MTEPAVLPAVERKIIHDHATPEQTAELIQQAVASAQQSGGYIVAVFKMENQQVVLTRAGQGFNRADFPTCLRLMAQDFDDEQQRAEQAAGGPPAILAPMKQAAPAPPVVDLFGTPPAAGER